ncbi:hypothetical protein SAY87_018486 [Trapa incisa]|uniref:Uncharacterized protein n=1 Tax=Trapa incisa TaxID=236973 RepID=A0AAN7L5H3_9MYRT|nr:hypothetical protein SAY87_018486 [Trapa incisa]
MLVDAIRMDSGSRRFSRRKKRMLPQGGAKNPAVNSKCICPYSAARQPSGSSIPIYKQVRSLKVKMLEVNNVQMSNTIQGQLRPSRGGGEPNTDLKLGPSS